MKNIIIALTIALQLTWRVYANTDNMDVRKACKRPLLTNNDAVPVSAFRSSSNWNDMVASKARLDPRDEGVVYAWCPKNLILPNKFEEWLEVDLGKLHIITMIQTMGRKANSQGREYTPEYRFSYKRELTEAQFRIYKKRDDSDILKGNDEASNPSIHPLEHAVVARVIRIYPNDREMSRHVCLKLELIGCPYDEDLVEYQIPQGDSFVDGLKGSFIDETYDGLQMPEHSGNVYLESGMGKLVDNRIEFRGPSEHGQDDQFNVHYVGWRKRPDRKKITLDFRFGSLRNFTQMRFYASNAFRMLIRLPKLIVVSFSVGRRVFQEGNQVRRVVDADSHLSIPRWINVSLYNNVASVLKVDLYFDDRDNYASVGGSYAGDWILLSEVMFESTWLPSNAVPQEKIIINSVANPLSEKSVSTDLRNTPSSPEQHHQRINIMKMENPLPSGMPSADEKNSKPYRESESYYVAVIVGCLIGVLVLLLLVAILWVRRRRYNKKQQHCMSVTAMRDNGHVHLDFHDGHPTMVINGKSTRNGSVYTSLPNSEDEDNLNNESSFSLREHSTNPFHGMAQFPSGGKVCEYASTTLLGKQLQLGSSNGPAPPPYSSSIGGVMLGKTVNLTMVPIDSQTGVFTKPQNFLNPIGDLTEVSPYSNPPAPFVSNGITPMSVTMLQTTPADSKVAKAMYMTAHQQLPPIDVRFSCGDLSIQGVSGTAVYAVPGEVSDCSDIANSPVPTAVSLEDVDLLEVDRSRLELQDKLGEGQFGEVCLAFLRYSTNGMASDHGMQVAVKMLRSDVNEQAKKDFYQEMRILARLDNPHIVRVIGVVTLSEPLCVLVEYMKYGDLHQFLQNKFPPTAADICNNFATSTSTFPGRNQQGLSCGCLLYMAGQIASGMKYMESLHVVHRDLAARNCLVGSGYQIKISDFGMSRSLYSSDYYRIEGRAVLPIRWMAWESVLLGKFTPKSDVWAFGVTLWEILNYCHIQPFSHLTDEDVIQNFGHVYANNGYQEWLPCPPPPCPREIYDLMRECWNRDEGARPTFHEIDMFLQRKTMGYNASDDYRSTGFVLSASIDASLMNSSDMISKAATTASLHSKQNSTASGRCASVSSHCC